MTTPFSKWHNIRRAHSVDEKNHCAKHIIEQWGRMPHLRLGQLLECVRTVEGVDIFSIEDGALMDALERFVDRFTKGAEP